MKYKETIFLYNDRKLPLSMHISSMSQSYLPAAFVIHLVAQVVRYKERLVVERRHQRVGARVRVLDADLDRVIFGQAMWRRRTDLFFGLRRCHAAVGQAQAGRAPAPSPPSTTDSASVAVRAAVSAKEGRTRC